MFGPKWKSTHPETREKGIERLNDPVVLCNLAKNDPDDGVRETAKTRLLQLRFEALKSLYFYKQSDRNQDQSIDERMALVNGQPLVGLLALDGANWEIRELATNKCQDVDVLQDIVDDKNLEYGVSGFLAALSQLWFLDDCARLGMRDDIDGVKCWLATGTRLQSGAGSSFASARCFRSVAIANVKHDSKVIYGTLKTNQTTTTYDLNDVQDHFLFRKGGANERDMLSAAIADRRKRGCRVIERVQIVEHKDWNRWVLKLLPPLRPPMDSLSPGMFAFHRSRAPKTRRRAIAWAKQFCVPLSFFVEFREAHQKGLIKQGGNSNPRHALSTLKPSSHVNAPGQATDLCAESARLLELLDQARRTKMMEEVAAGQAPRSDTETFKAAGGEWQTELAGPMSWAEAKVYASHLSLSGAGWRLPTGQELEGLLDAALTSETLKLLPGLTKSRSSWYCWCDVAEVRGGSFPKRPIRFSKSSLNSTASARHFVRCVRSAAVALEKQLPVVDRYGEPLMPLVLPVVEAKTPFLQEEPLTALPSLENDFGLLSLKLPKIEFDLDLLKMLPPDYFGFDQPDRWLEFLEFLKAELFELESEKLTGAISADEYREEKAAVELDLKRALMHAPSPDTRSSFPLKTTASGNVAPSRVAPVKGRSAGSKGDLDARIVELMKSGGQAMTIQAAAERIAKEEHYSLQTVQDLVFDSFFLRHSSRGLDVQSVSMRLGALIGGVEFANWLSQNIVSGREIAGMIDGDDPRKYGCFGMWQDAKSICEEFGLRFEGTGGGSGGGSNKVAVGFGYDTRQILLEAYRFARARTDAQVEMRTTPQNDFFLVFYTSSQTAYAIAREFTEASGHRYKDAGDMYVDVIRADSTLIEP